MSTEFNYNRAWEQHIKPAFDAIYPAIKAAYDATLAAADGLHQLTGETPELQAHFDAIPSGVLAQAEEIVYYYGHLAPSGHSSQEGGLYWKFEALACTSLIHRKADSELRYKAKQAMDTALKGFHDHKDGTEYDDEELPAHIRALVKTPLIILKADHVNHKSDVFVIGQRHFPKDGGMYIDPNLGPCYNCGRPYSEHKSDRALFVQPPAGMAEDTLRTELQALVKAVEVAGIKIDWFALVK